MSHDLTLVAHHEAGHAVAALAHDVGCEVRLTFDPVKGYRGRVDLIDLPPDRQLDQICILLAGAAQERYSADWVDGSSYDTDLAWKIARDVAGAGNPVAIIARQAWRAGLIVALAPARGYRRGAAALPALRG
jgi:hypothetical protein